MRVVRQLVIVAFALLVVACSGDEEAELKRRLEDHETRIADLESRLSQASLPRKAAVSAPASVPLASPPSVIEVPAAATETTPVTGISPSSAQATEDQRLAIRALCSRRFGSDWQSVERCEEEELTALEKIGEGNTEKLPPEIYGAIRVQCAQQGRGEFTRQLACQEEQVEAYLRTQ